MIGDDNNSQVTYYVIQFHRGRRVRSIHPEGFNREAARAYVISMRQLGVTCSMRRVTSDLELLVCGTPTVDEKGEKTAFTVRSQFGRSA